MNKTDKVFRRMGYKKEREGILSRYLNEKNGWEKHLDNSKAFILKGIEKYRSETCLIIGSGWWLDLPTEALSDYFKNVYLADISHPPQIRKKAEKYSNIHLITADITGAAFPVYQVIKAHKSKSDFAQIKEILQHADSFSDFKLPEPDYCVSLNLLSQIPIFITDFIKKKTYWSDNQIRELSQIIQKRHLEILPKNKSCIITDYEELCIGKKGGEHKKVTADIQFPQNKNSEEWLWHFDLSGNYRNCKKVFLKVKAVKF